MATLTVRLPAAATDRAVRQAAWARGLADQPRPAARRAGPVLAQVYEVQPPSGPSQISVAADSAVEASSGGWFESTWELQQGLDVAEGLPGDLPLEAWLKVYLNA